MSFGWKRILVTTVAVSFLCSGATAMQANEEGAEGMAYREKPSMTVKVDVLDAISDVLQFNVEQGECFQVELFAAGATGYQWELTNKDMKLFKVVKQFTGRVEGFHNITVTANPHRTVLAVLPHTALHRSHSLRYNET